MFIYRFSGIQYFIYCSLSWQLTVRCQLSRYRDGILELNFLSRLQCINSGLLRLEFCLVFQPHFYVLQNAGHEKTRVFLFRRFFCMVFFKGHQKGLWIAWSKKTHLLLNDVQEFYLSTVHCSPSQIQELKVYLWDEETGGVGGAEHVDEQLVSQHVQLLNLLPLYRSFCRIKHCRMHVKNCKKGSGFKRGYKNHRAGCSSLEGNRFWSTTRGRHSPRGPSGTTGSSSHL